MLHMSEKKNPQYLPFLWPSRGLSDLSGLDWLEGLTASWSSMGEHWTVHVDFECGRNVYWYTKYVGLCLIIAWFILIFIDLSSLNIRLSICCNIALLINDDVDWRGYLQDTMTFPIKYAGLLEICFGCDSWWTGTLIIQPNRKFCIWVVEGT